MAIKRWWKFLRAQNKSAFEQDHIIHIFGTIYDMKKDERRMKKRKNVPIHEYLMCDAPLIRSTHRVFVLNCSAMLCSVLLCLTCEPWLGLTFASDTCKLNVPFWFQPFFAVACWVHSKYRRQKWNARSYSFKHPLALVAMENWYIAVNHTAKFLCILCACSSLQCGFNYPCIGS